MKIFDIIQEANEHIHESLLDEGYTFSIRTDGFEEIIYFGDIRVWDSENSEELNRAGDLIELTIKLLESLVEGLDRVEMCLLYDN